MAIAFGSINTGLPKDIVQQLMNAERIPIEKMESRKGNIVEKKKLVEELIKLVEDLRGSINSNMDERSFRELKSTANDEIVNVSVDKNIANPGNHQFEVVQLAQRSSAMSSGFADKDDTYVGVGYIQYQLPNGENREIYIDSEHSSLSGIAKLINSDSQANMKASVINDGSGEDNSWRLLITMNDTGDNERAEFPYFYFVDGVDDLYLEYERPAQDAVVKIDGFEVEVPGNKVTDLIPGVTIDLKKAKPGEEFTVGVTEDQEATTKKVTDLIEKINKVLEFIKKQNSIDDKTDTSKTLGGDITLQNLETRLRGLIFKDFMTDSGPRRLASLGVTFQKTGLLAFDEKVFQAKASSDPRAIVQLLVGRTDNDGRYTTGFMRELSNVTGEIIRPPDGLLRGRARGLQSSIDQIDRRIADRQRLLEQKEKMLKDKFARLEGTISQIQKSGAGLAALGASASNPVQALG